jgi:hypothetical protein
VTNTGTFAVQIDSALPSGTNSIGKLSANSGVDIGDVDVTSVIPGTASANLGKAEDTAHSSGDVGVMSLAVRNDTLATLAGSDGDYAPIQVNADGAVYVADAVPNRISTTSFNSRNAATLAAGATFQGVSEDVSAYARVGISIISDNATDGTLTIEVSQDNSTWSGPTRTWSNTTIAQPHMWNIVEQYFRIKYVNGSTEATNLAIQVQYSNNANILLAHQLNGTLLDETEAIVARSVGVGQDPNDVYMNLEVSGVDNGNSSTTNLTTASSLVFTGTWINISGYAGITVLVDGTASGTVAGTLQLQFSHDGSTVHRDIPITNTDITNVPPRTLGVITKYFRAIYTAASDLTSFDLQTMLHTQQISLVSRLDQTLQGTEDVSNVRAAIVGVTDGGTYKNVPVTSEGHLEVAIHDPILPFGSIHTENLIPIFQVDAVYGINLTTLAPVVGHSTDGSSSATNTATSSIFKSSTGTTALSFATIQSRRRLRYRAGQGIIGRFAGFFSAPQASSIVVGGFGTGESGFYYGYNGTTFGVLHSTGGVREIQTLEITTASSATDDIQITLPSVTGAQAFTVSGITNASGSKELTAYQISKGTFSAWSAEQRGVYVVFLRNGVGVLTGTPLIAQSGAGTPAAGTYVETLGGVASTDTWVAQSAWNGDVCDGTGLSGFNLDHTKGNIFQIGVAWLGYGPVTFKIMAPSSGANNASWITVHTISNPNTRTTPHTSNPSYPFTMSAYSSGSTTDVTISVSSFAGFIEGMKQLTGPRSSFSNTSQSVSTGSYYTLFSIRNDNIYGNAGIVERANQAIVNILSFGGAHDDATPIIFYLLRNAVLVGTPVWTKWSTGSCIYWDTAATTATISNNNQIIQALPVGQTGTILMALEDTTTLQPGESLTVAATAVTGTSTWTIATLNTREDQ